MSYRVQVARADGGLLGSGGGLLGLPTLSVPDIGSILGIGGSSTSSSSASTSLVQSTSSSTIPLTTSSSSSIELTTSASATSTSASATVTSSDSTSLSASSTSLSSATDSATVTPTPTPTQSATSLAESLPASSSSTTSSSASASATSQASTQPKSFLQNKALSVGVITAASLVGVILIVILATWAVRRRRNDRLHKDILDFSTANLMKEPMDTEKGAIGLAEGGSSLGHGSGSSSGHVAVPPSRLYQQYNNPPAYQQPSRNAQPYGAPSAYAANAYGGYQPNTTYDNYGYGYGGYGNAPQAQTGYSQPAYRGMEDPYGGMADPYGGMVDPNAPIAVGAGAQNNAPVRRPSANRKPPPPLEIPPSNPIAQPVNATPVSITGPPMQAAAPPLTLPDEFGASPQEPPRRLFVRNE